ncbi:FMN-binding domain protein [Nocardioides dokdonensis FR1436]|uniref:FMN-binding domain protein n=1 Tax=Nocardioides dokdonensis FR1436 TaxID=1300347 RepID=A0A1A9GSK8_9ACTN|nr:FMN-binding protein [Nocardioides dokdonensis]ANH40465.1 FMN-binding domain protein [Nocardioides dokdonensis FR1436]
MSHPVTSPPVRIAASVLGVLLLIGLKTLTSDQTALGPAVDLVASDHGTVDGPLVSTRYGPVQVRVTVQGGVLTDVVSLRLPTGGRSGQIADYSAPVLRREALAAQGTGVDAVSGATYTSQGYADSLQGALDQIAAGDPSSSA